MTVQYSGEVFTTKGIYGLFLRLLCRWNGSIYKLVWPDLVVYVCLYYVLSFTYRFLLTDDAKATFESVSLYCSSFADLIPVTFVLGFYVNLVIQRWWNQFESLPWPDSASLWISTCIHGHDDRGRLMRRSIVRYLNLSQILTMRLVCLPVKKRFPTLDHLVDAGILTEEERKILGNVDQVALNHPKYWMPLIWAGSIVTRARKEGRISNDHAMQTVIEKIDHFRALAGALLSYDWVNIPLVYTQVTTLAVYSFLLSTLMGRQFLDPGKKLEGHEVDLVVPVFTFLQFFFYMGWLKVAEALINPFGEDDDDFDINWIIDRNLQVSYLIVDEMHSEHPELIRDQFWDELFPELPYTAAAEDTRNDPVIGAAKMFEVPEDEAEFLPINDDDFEKERGKLTEVIVDNNAKLDTGVAIVDNVDMSNEMSNENNLGTVALDSPLLVTTKIKEKSKLKKMSSDTKDDDRGSVASSTSKLNSRQSLASSVITRAMMMTQQLGSTNSIFSNRTSRLRRRRQQRQLHQHQQHAQAHHPLRSVSRINSISSAGGGNHSPRFGSKSIVGQAHITGTGLNAHDESRNLSINSSLNSLILPSVDAGSEYSMHTSKFDVRDLLKSEFSRRRQHRQSDHMEHKPRNTVQSSMTNTTRMRSGTKDLSEEQSRKFRLKLEAIHSLQSDILTLLDQRDDANHEAMETQELLQQVEDRTHELRHLAVNLRSATSPCPSPNLDTQEVSEVATPLPDLTIPTSINTDAKESHHEDNSTAYLTTPLQPTTTSTANRIEDELTVSLNDLNTQEQLGTAINPSADEGFSNNMNNSTNNMGELSNVSLGNGSNGVAVTGALAPSMAAEKLEEKLEELEEPLLESKEDNLLKETSPDTFIELSTIEEKEELGYQSDSSDTDSLLSQPSTPGAALNSSDKRNKNAYKSLETVDEEDHNNINEDNNEDDNEDRDKIEMKQN